MTSDGELKKPNLFSGHEEFELTYLNDVQYIRDPEGVWHYADTWIEVPGARDLTLTERFEPKFIINGGGEVERVVVPGESIEEFPELLEWCLDIGTAITDEDGEIAEVFVPIEAWRERDRVPGALVAPEHTGNPAEQELAQAERAYREAERRLEIAADNRAEVLRRHSDEMTRQEARAITGLSVGRIQQLIRSEGLSEVEKTLLQVLDTRKSKTFESIEKIIEASDLPTERAFLVRRLRELEMRGLIETTKTGFRLTKDGRDVLAEEQKAERSDAEVETG